MPSDTSMDWAPLWQGAWHIAPSDVLTFTSLGSGSSGNCYLLTLKGASILIDAGIGIRKTLKALDQLPFDLHKAPIRAIFVTHDHADHTRAVVPLAYKLQVPIYASPLVARALYTHRYASDNIHAYLRKMEVGSRIQVGEMELQSFEVPHDATHNVGYQIRTPRGCLSIITDIGHITEEIIRVIGESTHLIFESNYDEEMLAKGQYPEYLKERIRSGSGHLSNRIAAETIAKYYHPNLKAIVLCHLSQDNNHPDLARQAFESAFDSRGLHLSSMLKLEILPRTDTAILTFL